MDLLPILIIFVPILSAIIIYIFQDRRMNILAFFSQILSTAIIIFYKLNLRSLEPHFVKLGGWDKSIGIALKNDNISLSFVLLAIFIWWIIIIYGWSKHKHDTKYHFFLLMLQGCFMGLLQTNDLFNLFLFIELTTMISAILIIYKKDGYSVRAGLYYLLFNTIGMLFFLIGILLVYTAVGTLNMDIAAVKLTHISEYSVVKLAYIFMLAAVGVKSAFFPVYNWLPKAHGAAPASISALLSGLLVKSGLYGFIRLNQMFEQSSFLNFFILVGFFTALSGVVFALCQKDIKQVLAFHTISQVGLVLMGLSAMEGTLFYGGLLHAFNHAIFKTLLFLCVGNIISTYNTRRIPEIRGVFRSMPYISIFMIVGMLAITGSPLFNGFVSKSIIKYGFSDIVYMDFMINIINVGTAASFVKLSQIFVGKRAYALKSQLTDNAALLILSLACIVFGIFYVPLTRLLWDIDILSINLFSLEKWLIYIVTLSFGFLVYQYVIKKDYRLVKAIRHTVVSFETASVMLIVFVCIMIIWSKFMA